METDILLPSIPAIAGLSFAGLIVFIIAAVQESKHGSPTADIVKRGYLYLVSFVTVLILSASLVSLFDTGLRATAFTKANTLPSYKQTPPTLYLPTATTTTPEKVVSNALACTSPCSLTAEQKDSITAWEQQYKDWKQTTSVSFQRSQSLVLAISFLVIALIVYVFHWMLASRDHKQHASTAMRITHFWAVSFIMLITVVISAAFLLNTTLKALLIKGDTGTADTVAMMNPSPVSAERTGVDSIVTCGSACGLSASTIQAAHDWQNDYAAVLKQSSKDLATRNRHNGYVKEIAFLIVALPLFVYHFKTVWQETKKGQASTTV